MYYIHINVYEWKEPAADVVNSVYSDRIQKSWFALEGRTTRLEHLLFISIYYNYSAWPVVNFK